MICIMPRQIHLWNFKSICRKMTKNSPENKILAKGNNSCKSKSNTTKVKLDLYYVKTNSYTKFQVNITKDRREKFGKLFLFQRVITQEKVRQTQPNSNLICIMSRQIHIPNFKSISQRTTEKSLENWVDGHEWADWLRDGQTDRRRGNL